MKANELMLGDHVSHFDEGKNCVVTELRGSKVAVSYTDDNGSTKYSELLPEMAFEPIPLTIEILKKNGFNETFWGGEWTNNNVDFILIEHNDGFRMIDTNIVLSGVHHFQHALRLCNIEKEIEL